MKAFSIFFVLICLLAGGIVRWGLDAQFNADNLPAETLVQAKETTHAYAVVAAPTITPVPASTSKATATLPATAQLNVAFTSQAPFAVWDALHEDACEEASLVTVQSFLNGATSISKDAADAQITDLANWEAQHGYGTSITLEQLNMIAATKYGLKTGKVLTHITAEDIKREIAAGHPVILGMAGKLLVNPNFKDGGPNYHMLVVTGYDATGFVTNDPGTRLGQNFHYDYAGFMNALHDWSSDNILNGAQNMLVFQ